MAKVEGEVEVLLDIDRVVAADTAKAIARSVA